MKLHSRASCSFCEYWLLALLLTPTATLATNVVPRVATLEADGGQVFINDELMIDAPISNAERIIRWRRPFVVAVRQ
jgi:hypothetical protein